LRNYSLLKTVQALFSNDLKGWRRQIRRSLRTTDPNLAKRRLRKFEKKADRLRGGDGHISFDELSK